MSISIMMSMERCALDREEDVVVEEHMRGRDMFLANATVLNEGFKDSLTKGNIPFCASASGTTSTLFTAAMTFSNLICHDQEAKKQYLLACVAYLVGGGMHTCHELFWTARLSGIPYKDGKYLEVLPIIFLKSEYCQKWTHEFWDIIRPNTR
jgi:hypothetical protein